MVNESCHVRFADLDTDYSKQVSNSNLTHFIVAQVFMLMRDDKNMAESLMDAFITVALYNIRKRKSRRIFFKQY